jgi:hypothetical protein
MTCILYKLATIIEYIHLLTADSYHGICYNHISFSLFVKCSIIIYVTVLHQLFPKGNRWYGTMTL